MTATRRFTETPVMGLTVQHVRLTEALRRRAAKQVWQRIKSGGYKAAICPTLIRDALYMAAEEQRDPAAHTIQLTSNALRWANRWQNKINEAILQSLHIILARSIK